MCNPVSIADLHRLAYPRFPKADVHQILHDAAAMQFRVQSLSECNAQQLEALASFVRDHPVRPSDQSSVLSSQSTENRKLNTDNSRGFRCTTRPRSGSPIAPGTIRLASTAQKGLIRRLFGELAWSESTANNWLVRFHGVDTIDQIATVQDASKIIHHLMRIKADKGSGRRSCHGEALGRSRAAFSGQRTRC